VIESELTKENKKAGRWYLCFFEFAFWRLCRQFRDSFLPLL